MSDSRPSSPDAPPQDLWSSILDSVSSSRSIPAKQILILGEPSSGKSTLASALLHKSILDEDTEEHQRTDFALGYEFADVRDDADEGVYMRAMPRTATRFVAHIRVFASRYPRKTVCIHRTIVCASIYRAVTPFPSAPDITTTYRGDHRSGLDKAMDVRGRAAKMVELDRDLGQS